MKVIIVSEERLKLFLNKVEHSDENRRGLEVGQGIYIPHRRVHYLACEMMRELKESDLI